EYGCDADARAAARNILKYFDNAAPNHHADEEQSLFPRLLRAIPRDAELLIGDLERQHVSLAENWAKLRPLLAAISAGCRENLSPKQVADASALYQRHIAREESELIPLAAEVCNETMIAEIGREMAQRRGIDASQTQTRDIRRP